EIRSTESGRVAAASLGGGQLDHGLTHGETQFLAKLGEKDGWVRTETAAKLRIDAAALERLRRKGLIEIRETMLAKKQRTQRIVAWKIFDEASALALEQKSARVKTQLDERGPLPLPQLLKLARVSRTWVDRLLRDGLLESWEERVDPAEDPFDV